MYFVDMLVLVPKEVECTPYMVGFIAGMRASSPLPIQDISVLRDFPLHLKEEVEKSARTIVYNRDGKTYLWSKGEDDLPREVEVTAIRVTILPPDEKLGSDASQQLPMMFNGLPPKIYDA